MLDHVTIPQLITVARGDKLYDWSICAHLCG